ncbi:MAG: PKD domain-containing protein [Thermoplasmatales archaeon]|nr:MAG: PKD domain-containing protein [Thermoplasmatales archaeon]
MFHFVVMGVAADEGDTTVSLDLSSQTVSAGDTFVVNVSCVPGQPIKAFEFRLAFDPTLLQATLVDEGDIFEGYTTIFDTGTIDNNTGNIVDIFGLIWGPGNVSDPGTFVTISFTAKDASGTSSLDINGVGVTNETGYVSVDVYDGSVTVQGTNPPGGGGSSGGGGGGYIPPPVVVIDENNPPENPLTPTGPVFVEMSIEYIYSSSAVDVDGDLIRYRFDWGDGNYSDWSELVASNTSVSMFHSWDSISTFGIMVIAQDENGSNSSWSPSLNVTVSAIDLGGEPPVVDIAMPGNLLANQTIVFDASGSFDEDSVIVSYYWDFGDGENGNGITTSHIYENPGEYTVTLVVTDNSDIKHSKSLIVHIASEAKEDKQGLLQINLGTVFFGFATVILICLVVVFRKKIFLSTQYNHLSNSKIFDRSNKIKKIDDKINKLKKTK